MSKLLETLKKFNIINIFKETYEKGIVFAGISAGALCWGMNYFETEFTGGFKTIEGFSDYKKVECMGFLPFIICPHYNLDGYKEKMNLMVKEYGLPGIAINNNCSVQFVNGKYRVIATKEEANAYNIYTKGTEIVREAVLKDTKFRPIEELFHIDQLS